MTRRMEWMLLALLALAGLGLAFRDAPLREPYPAGITIPSRATIKQRAEAMVRNFGYDVSGWPSVLSTERSPDLRSAYAQNRVPPGWRLRSPESVTATFLGPNKQRCTVTQDAGGYLMAFNYEPFGSTREIPMATEGDAEQARALALQAFAARWRSASAATRQADIRWRLSADAVPEEGGFAFEWTSAPDPNNYLAWQVRLLVRNQHIQRFEVSPVSLDALRALNAQEVATLEPIYLAVFVLLACGMLWADVLALINTIRGRVPWAFVLRASSLTLGIFLVDALGGAAYANFRLAWQQDVRSFFGVALAYAAAVAAAAGVIIAGRAVRSSDDFRRWLALEDLLRLAWGKASINRALWVSVAVACVAAGIPMLVARMLDVAIVRSATLASATFRIPVWPEISNVSNFALLLAAAFTLPVLKARVSNLYLRALLAALLTSGCCVFIASISRPAPAMLLEALLLGLLMVYTYWRFGVLPALLAPLIADTLLKGCVFFAMGDTAPQLWAAGALVGIFLLFAVALILDLRNPNRQEELRLSEEEFAALKRESERRLLSRRETLLGEFALAQRAQQRMLPSRPPVVPGFEISSVCLPAQQVGGDLFDYIRLPDARVAFCVADVSGKGVSAALYMTMVKGLLNALRLERADLMDLVTSLNQRVYEVMRRRSFVTMVLAALDAGTRTLEVLRAGHLPVLHVRADGQHRFISSTGMGLGLAPSTLFCRSLNTTKVKLQPGDVTVLYSDGVTEAMNVLREEFGEERLAAVVTAAAALPATEIRTRLLSAVRDFQGGAPVHDDITVVVLKAAAHPAGGAA